jgi:hypothetical protein
VGVLDPEMVEAIVAIPGFPLEILLDLDYSMADISLSLSATTFERTETPPQTFRILDGFRPIEEAKASAAMTCPVCGAEVKSKAVPLVAPGGERRYYDSEVCKEKDLERILEGSGR